MHLVAGLVVVAAAVVAGCDPRRDTEPARPPGATEHALRPIAELRGRATLIAGTRRIALWVGDAGWYEPAAGKLVAHPALGAALARARAALGGELVDLHLGSRPILAGGEDHREQVLQFGPQPRPVELDGMVVQVAMAGPPPAHAASGEIEVWRIERALRSDLVTIDGGGVVATLPGFTLVGPPLDAASPVSAKACAAPKLRELAGGGDAVVVLVTECAAAAPVRIATYRWPGPSVTVTALPALGALGFEIDRLVATRAAEPILVGRRGDTLVIARIGADGRLATTEGPTGVEAVADVAVADDGAVWTLTITRAAGGRDRREVARDGKRVQVTSPRGAEVRPERLAVDDQLGIVVLGWENAARWLLAERATGAQEVIAE